MPGTGDEELRRRIQEEAEQRLWNELRSTAEGRRVEALHGALRDQLLTVMEEAEWVADPSADLQELDGTVGSFRCRVANDFACTAMFAWFGDYPPLRVDTVIGLSYERSFRAWPLLLDGPPHSELRISLAEVSEGLSPVELWEIEEVSAAVTRLAAPVIEHAVRWAEPLASVDALLDALRAQEDEITELADIPVVLAASGRVDEARQTLDYALNRHRSEAGDPFWRTFVQRFDEWLTAPDSA